MKQIKISIEGIDGAGKTTVIRALKERYGSECTVYSRTKKGKKTAKLVSIWPVKYVHFLQVPIYLFLSHSNYRKLKEETKQHHSILLMDRCFLSNLCYFFPHALHNHFILKLAMFFEPVIEPQKIFILDVAPATAQKRDHFQKELLWLEKTRDIYLKSAESTLLKKYHIEVIEDVYTIKQKVELIAAYIDRERCASNASHPSKISS